MDIDFSQYDLVLLQETIDDLQVKSMLFDLDIDWETLALYEASDYREPFWLTRWKEKPNDRTPQDYEGGKDGRF